MTVVEIVLAALGCVLIPILTLLGTKVYFVLDKGEQILNTTDKILVSTDRLVNKTAEGAKNAVNSFSRNSDEVIKSAGKIVGNISNLIDKEGVAGGIAKIATSLAKS
mgnify:CR=1 FL=1